MKRLLLILMAICILFTACNTDSFTRLKKDERIFLELSKEEQMNIIKEIVVDMKDSLERSKETEYYKNNKDFQTESVDDALKDINDELQNPKDLLDSFTEEMKEDSMVCTIKDTYALLPLMYDLRKYSEVGQEEKNEIYSSLMNMAEFVKETQKAHVDLDLVSNTFKKELTKKEYDNMEVFDVIEKVIKSVEEYIN